MKKYKRGIVIFLYAFSGAIVCTIGTVWIYIARCASPGNALYEDAIYAGYLKYIVTPIALIAGTVIGSGLGWWVTRTRQNTL